MPLYCYRCPTCQQVTEELQSLSEPPLHVCTGCKKEGLQRVFGVPNIICRGFEHCKTVQQQAEFNTQKLYADHGTEKADQILREKQGVSRSEQEVNVIPWWRSGHVEGTGPMQEKPLDIRKIKDQERYIATGQTD